ncbi:MAG: hypothetical protein E6K78_04820 [Candidatus Eisenbacteria bacterium]|uniref:YbaK/aminoacyl-tRNA synthetase-associated domain-containing protein n=1 Tax=Eiseniibacteriota bacterium TaxID=2212470 RepID=A0A538TUW9_UNCEI|nr:MAG: hypothetical protein E6K78_04820 [Candidatus Eisenbacteria bacterium]
MPTRAHLQVDRVPGRRRPLRAGDRLRPPARGGGQGAGAVTGYPAGGTPPVGHREPIPVIVDVHVAAQEWGWAGGGRLERLLKIAPADIVRIGGARVAEVTASS